MEGAIASKTTFQRPGCPARTVYVLVSSASPDPDLAINPRSLDVLAYLMGVGADVNVRSEDEDWYVPSPLVSRRKLAMTLNI